MGIGADIKQSRFKSEFSKAIINLMFTSNWLNEKQHRLFKPYGLTSAQYNVLRILRGQYPKPSTVNLLIDRMLDRMSNASRIVDKLVAKGLVTREQNASDRRAVDVIVSEKGLALLTTIDEELDSWEDSLNRFTDDECQQFNKLLDKFRGSEPD